MRSSHIEPCHSRATISSSSTCPLSVPNFSPHLPHPHLPPSQCPPPPPTIPPLKHQRGPLGLLIPPQLEVLAALEAELGLGLAIRALEPEHDLLGRLGLFVEDGLRLAAVARLLAVVAALALGDGGGLLCGGKGGVSGEVMEGWKGRTGGGRGRGGGEGEGGIGLPCRLCIGSLCAGCVFCILCLCSRCGGFWEPEFCKILYCQGFP